MGDRPVFAFPVEDIPFLHAMQKAFCLCAVSVLVFVDKCRTMVYDSIDMKGVMRMLDGVIYVVFLIAAGCALVRGRLLPKDGSGFLSSLLMTLCFPAMILNCFLALEPKELLSTGLTTAVVTVVFSLLPALVLLLKKEKGPLHSLYSFICGIGNVSFVCIPLLRLFLPEEEMLTVYLHVSIQDFLIWGLFHPAFAGGQSSRQWKKILTEPCMLAVLVGLILCLFRVELPSFLSMPLEALDACVSPLALVFLGMTLAQYGSNTRWLGKTPLCYTLYKVVAYPLVIFGILTVFLPWKEALLMAALFGSPAPIASVIWMHRYTNDPTPAIACVIPSTLLYFLLYTPLLLLL